MKICIGSLPNDVLDTLLGQVTNMLIFLLLKNGEIIVGMSVLKNSLSPLKIFVKSKYVPPGLIPESFLLPPAES